MKTSTSTCGRWCVQGAARHAAAAPVRPGVSGRAARRSLCPGNPGVFRFFLTLEASISVGFQPDSGSFLGTSESSLHEFSRSGHKSRSHRLVQRHVEVTLKGFPRSRTRTTRASCPATGSRTANRSERSTSTRSARPRANTPRASTTGRRRRLARSRRATRPPTRGNQNVQDTFNMVECERMWQKRSSRPRKLEQR